MAFMPKESLYYLLEESLKKFDVVISKESLQSSMLSLRLNDMQVSVKGIESAVVEEADITLLLLYNKIEVQNITLSSVAESFVPAKIESLDVSYTIFNPLEITLNAVGDFGEVEASVMLLDRNITLGLAPSKLMLSKHKNSLRIFKKNENGEYIYAKSF